VGREGGRPWSSWTPSAHTLTSLQGPPLSSRPANPRVPSRCHHSLEWFHTLEARCHHFSLSFLGPPASQPWWAMQPMSFLGPQRNGEARNAS